MTKAPKKIRFNEDLRTGFWSHTDTKARDEAHNNVHGNIDASSLKAASDHGECCGYKESLAATEPVGSLGAREGAEQAAGLEQAIDGALKL